MKKILLLLALLASATLAAAQNTVTVSGDLIQMTGAQQNGVANQTFVRFRLRNYSGNVPRINGTGLLAPCVVDSDTRCDITPDSLGHFSLTVAGNDVVTPSNTYYDVMIYINGRLAFAGPYSFTQALCPSGCNLDTYGQLNPPPTPAVSVAPFLSSNNIFTGTNTFNGAVTFNSTVIFGLGAQTFVTPRFTPPITINTGNAITWSFTNPAAPRTLTWPDQVDASANVQYSTGARTNGNLMQFNANGNAIDSSIAANTVVTLAGTQTLTNKTIDANFNTFQNLIPTVVMKKGTGSGAYSTTSTASVDVDATNLSYTVTIPTGWCLIVSATGFGSVMTGSQDVFYSLHDSVGGTLQEIGAQPKSTTDLVPFALNYVIVGDGASHTIRLQFRTQNAADACVVNNSSGLEIPIMTFQLMKTN